MLAPGCFYLDPINERPSAEIVRDTIALPFRGDTAYVHAESDDPDGDSLELAWSARACGPGGASCDAIAYVTGTQVAFDPTVPLARADGAPTAAIRVALVVRDRWGAFARPEQELVIDVQDHAPSLIVQHSGRDVGGRTFPVGVPIRIAAMFDDLDVTDDVTLTWEPFPAPGSRPELASWGPWPGPAMARIEEMKLIPDIDGNWTIRVTADDHQGGITVVDEVIDVVADTPPCLGALDPGTAPDATIIVDAPRRFAVLSVDDDINVYPAPSANDDYLRAASFAWSIASPASGGVLEPVVGLEAHDLVIDPAHYQPGDVLDVRVEIGDAIARTLPCDPAAPSCSLEASSCRQRQTWHVEIR